MIRNLTNFKALKSFALLTIILSLIVGLLHVLKPQDIKTIAQTTNKPLVLVQLHTWWSTPENLNASSGWGYWGVFTNVKPNTLYSNALWPRRIIPSLKYPISYNSNKPSEAINLSLNDILDVSNAGSYPYIGVYDSTNEEVIRYQLRLAKSTGIDALGVSVFDVYADDRINNGNRVCPGAHIPDIHGGLDRFIRYLNIAAEENIGIFVEIWTPGNIGGSEYECGSLQSWEHMVTRVLNQSKNHPAYYKINNRPVVSPAFFVKDGNNWSFQESINRIFWATGGQDLFWLVRGTRDKILSYTGSGNSLNGVNAIAVGSVLRGKYLIANPDYNHQTNEISYVKNNHPDRYVASHIYPGFDDTFRRNHPYYISTGYKPVGLARYDGNNRNVFSEQLRRSINTGADIIFIESWNDYQEQTQIEPSRVVNGAERFDPYQDLRTLASALGKSFTEPPLPPKSARDQLPFLQFRSGTVNPSVLEPKQTAQVTCDYGVIRDCISPKVGTGHWQSCSWDSFNGTSSMFSCTAPTNGGDYVHTCTLFSGSSQHCLPQEDIASTYRVVSVSPTTTPTPTATPTTKPPTPTPTPTPPDVPGDGNGDQLVNREDYLNWQNHYSQSTSNGPSDGDFNQSGKVDGIDFIIWLNNYTG